MLGDHENDSRGFGRNLSIFNNTTLSAHCKAFFCRRLRSFLATSSTATTVGALVNEKSLSKFHLRIIYYDLLLNSLTRPSKKNFFFSVHCKFALTLLLLLISFFSLANSRLVVIANLFMIC